MRYVHYGCAFTAPPEWINYDASPSLVLQKVPFLSGFVKSKLYEPFPSNVRYGNIVKGLPEITDSCDAVYCSHTLEHLALEDFRTALKNTFSMIKPGGCFRCVVPDLELAAAQYLKAVSQGDASASIAFTGDDTLLGTVRRERGLEALLRSLFGNSRHLWMWDHLSLSMELQRAGFDDVRKAQIGDGGDAMFDLVEDPSRFERSVALHAVKPISSPSTATTS